MTDSDDDTAAGTEDRNADASGSGDASVTDDRSERLRQRRKKSTEGAGATETDASGGDRAERPGWLSLDPDEEVVWVGEPALASLVGTVVTGVVLSLVLIGVLILLATPLAYLSLKNTDYVVTNQSLYVKKGILGTSIETVDIDRIQNTAYSQSFWGRQLGYGSIDVSTAGSSGAEITFKNIANARGVRETISELGADADADADAGLGVGTGAESATTGAESGPRTGGADADAAPASREQLDDLVAELRATRRALERVEAKLADDEQTAGSDDGRDDDGGA